MTLQVSDVAFVAFLLATVRAGAWMAVAPPFNHQSIPLVVRAGVAASLGLALEPWLAQQLGSTPFDAPTLIGQLLVQILAGAGLGMIVRVLMSAVQSAGSMIDLFGGFTISTAFDPFSHSQAAVWGRFYDLLTVVLLFAIDGHLLLLHGFMASFQAMPLHAPAINQLADTVLRDVTTLMVSAVEIAAPLVAVLFLAQIVMGLLSKAAPSMNVLSFSFPFTILLTILLASVAVPALPGAVRRLVEDALRSMAQVTGR